MIPLNETPRPSSRRGRRIGRPPSRILPNGPPRLRGYHPVTRPGILGRIPPGHSVAPPRPFRKFAIDPKDRPLPRAPSESTRKEAPTEKPQGGGGSTKRHKFTHDEILDQASQDSSNFVVVLAEEEEEELHVPWWVYVIMHTQKAKRFKCRTHVGRSRNPFRKEVFHNLKALKRCKVTRPAAGHWKLCMVVGPFLSEQEACQVVKEWRKSKRAEYGRHAYGMNLCMNSDGRLLCFSSLLTEDVPISKLNQLPPEYLTPFKSSPVGNQRVAELLESKAFRDSLETTEQGHSQDGGEGGKRKGGKESSESQSEPKRSKTTIQSSE